MTDGPLGSEPQDRAPGTVLVVGGGGAIGAATAQIFGRSGYRVAVADLDADAAAAAGAGVTPSAVALQCDITDPDACRRTVTEAADALGGLDVVVNTVGWTAVSQFVDEDVDYWRKIVELNLLGSLYLTRAALDHMIGRGSGSIVLTSSDAGRVGTNGETAYAAAKAGVIGFVKSIAREVARHGIRVNAVSPGPTDTPLLWEQADERFVERMVRGVPLRRLARPEEPAEAIAFLASRRADYITGQTLSVSGGLTMSS